MRIVFLWLIIHFFVPSYCWGQYPYVQIISQEKGFGKSNISILLEDHQGVIWAGTELGLLRFDGLQTTTYLPEKGNSNSLSNEYIYDMFEDKNHFLWIATRSGLNSIDPSRKKITRYMMDSDDTTSIPNNRIFQLIPDTDSTFLIISDRSGLSSFNTVTGKTNRLNPPIHSQTEANLNGPAPVFRGFRTPDGTVYVSPASKLCQYDRVHNLLIDIQDTISGIQNLRYFGNYHATKEGALWLSDLKGIIYKWVPGQYVTAFEHQELMTSFQPGQFWIIDYNHQFMLISTGRDYWLMDKECGGIQHLKFREDQSDILEHTTIQTCLETSKGIVVLGSNAGNLYIIDPLLQQFKYKNLLSDTPDGDFQTSISDFWEDPKYHMRYISVLQDSFFYVENMNTKEVKNIHKARMPNIANQWMFDHEGRLWLCDGTTLQEINRVDQSMKTYIPQEPTRNMFDMVEIRPGEMMIATLGNGLIWFKSDSAYFEKIPEKKGWKKTQIFSLKLDKKHSSVWIGTVNRGLFRYDIHADTFYHYQYYSRNPHSLAGDVVKDITIDSMGYAWFSTDAGGLSRFDYNANPDSAFTNISMADGLPTNYITGLETDRRGNIWMLSLNGIASLHTPDFSIKLYGKQDGLPRTKFTHANISISRDNIVYVGTSKGYIYFRPDHITSNRSQPDLDIRDVLVFDKSRLNHNADYQYVPLKLKYKENYLTIQFSVINYTEPELNTVKYIMEGLDDDWQIRSGINQVSYTKIPPGNYTFRILAANNDGVWNPNERTLSILIRPPFWQRTWFYILIGAFVSSIIFAFLSYRFRQKLKQKLLIAEKEWLKNESEQQLTQLEMKALRAQMNPHFIFNCLNSINRFIVVNDNDSASEYLTKFSRLIRQVLDNSRGEKVSLLTEIETLKLYIEMEFLRFGNKFEYKIILNPGLEPEKYVVQPMLIQPYVENAIWHGLMHRKEKGFLWLHFSRMENTLHVMIEDNGVGRAMAKKIKESQLITRKSHGMQVTAERMSLLSQQMKVPVQAIVDDLFDNNHQSIGTKVSITLPLEQI